MSLPEIIACLFCGRAGPTVPDDELIVTIDDFESAARQAGWHQKSAGWICPECWKKLDIRQ
jgi:hypothetical protein